MARLDGRVILVTGAEGNMGPHVTDELVSQGATVVGTWFDEEELEWAHERGAHTDEVNYYEVDLTDPEQTAEFAATVEREHGAVSGIVNLVGGFDYSTIEETDPELFQLWFDLVATTVYLTTKSFLDQLKATKGSVVNFTSERATNPPPNTFAYSVGKGAVRTMTESLAAGLDDVRVNALAPYFIATPEKREEGRGMDAPHWHMAEDIIDIIVFLLESPALSGAILKPTDREPGAEPLQ